MQDRRKGYREEDDWDEPGPPVVCWFCGYFCHADDSVALRTCPPGPPVDSPTAQAHRSCLRMVGYGRWPHRGSGMETGG